jgi:DNA polymerase III subunit beta
MIFAIEKEVFLDGLSKAVPITERKSSLPILSHVLMEAKEEHLVLTATDLAVGLRISCEYTMEEPGSIAVPGKKILEIVKELSSGKIHIALMENGRIKISSGNSVFDLAGMDGSDYPAWASFDQVTTAQIHADRLVYMVDKTLFASSNDESRFNLNAVLFEQAEEKIKLVATDGHRLAMIDEDLGMALPVQKVVVPKRSLLELKRMLENIKEEIALGFDPKNMIVSTDRFMMTVRLTEGDYPDYRKVIPPASEKKMKADRGRFIQTLRRVAILTSDRNRGITLDMHPGQMEITAVHPDLGTAKDVIDVEYEGEAFSLIVNVLYLMESLASVDSDTVMFEFHEEGEPIIVTPDPPKNYFNLVMPMRK